ncbi:hypothetical protein [Shewanella xiamenensis]|uniref:hypothetical protein n=1 Tax=Shewanella xiamenensis TaxID=332186 RepID=UPI0021C23A68|nr:hypothetical protein [Shewanella xiamenensis]MCT8866939.1 hypothetical protein [Shewanella xiamenensis]
MDLASTLSFLAPIFEKFAAFFQNAAVITASAALLGVHLSNKASERRIALQFTHEAKAKSTALKLEKLEHILTLFYKWEMDISSVYLTFLGVYNEELSYSDAMKVINENRLQTDGDYQVLKTLLNLYFNDLLDEFAILSQARKEVISYVNPKRIDKSLKQDFIQAQLKFEKQAYIFSQCIVQQSLKLK